jgi:hypothetical protein
MSNPLSMIRLVRDFLRMGFPYLAIVGPRAALSRRVENSHDGGFGRNLFPVGVRPCAFSR